ncbi:Extracellular matrix-binding ebh [Babesia ovata]|uniref:Extracellular matrix-binding ebh n=1 Tax=Babesia ovata TaxID=189622 RepID=A0A2H6KIZ0_9APIC|nr:Extracellular matrix-binding ebh [Babesia ovata]GBE62957.1 Extracellular matrix-binding ebh [Babesia ovata]
MLQEKGKTLLTAAQKAKKTVEQNVTEALQAIVQMDKSLKTDLKKVKDDIKIGIDHVIKTLQVKELDTLVNEQPDPKSNIVGDQFKLLQEPKEKFNQDTKKITEETQQLEQNFGKHIKTPLNSKVQAVTQAIGELGERFELSGGNEKKLDMIFEHIKDKVAEIKGSERDQKGLDGIVAKVKALARAFVNPGRKGFNARVGGWLEAIIGNGKGPRETGYKAGLAAVNSWLQQYKDAAKKGGPGEQALRDQVKNHIMAALNSQIGAAQGKIGAVKEGIKENLTAIVSACETFVKELDKKIAKTQIDHLVQQIVPNIKSWASRQSLQNFNQDDNLNTAVKYILVALCASVRQVSTEINSLGTDKFGKILDAIKPVVDGLYSNLEQATNNFPSNQDGTAKAVDSKLQAVRDEVTGLPRKFTAVKQDLQNAVGLLPNAVDTFNTAAEDQIKEAAKTAISKAAKIISEDPSGEVKLEKSGPMSTFYEAHNNIKQKLPKDLQALLDTHIGKYDQTGGTGGVAVQPDKVTLPQLFTLYRGHVVPEKVPAAGGLKGKQDEGLLPAAIGNIKTKVFEELENTLGDSTLDKNKIDDKTFTVPFGQIKNQVEAIAGLVDNTKGTPPTYHVGDKQNGIKQWLAELKNALSNKNGNALWNGFTKGLEQIQSVINDLQSNPFTSGPKEIGTAVEAIKLQLKELRGKLKKENGDPKDGVINVLEDLQTVGLDGKNGKQWTPNGKGQPLSGLGKIQQGLQEQNKQLGEQNKIIGDAVRKIQLQLRYLGFKLDHDFVPDDIMDQLQKLKSEIDKGGKGGLQVIYNVISGLQSGEFTQKPQNIQAANAAIKAELKAQMSALGSEVIKALTNLMTTGLSNEASWQGTKGLENIKNNLHTQQTTLSQQHPAIGGGVDQITKELDDLRSELQGEEGENAEKRGVIRNMDFMIEKIGTNDDDKDCLKKIKKEIEELNRDTVPDINKFLGELCAKIASEAGSVDWQLGLFKENNIDKDLAKIKTQIDTLRTGDLQAAIAMCDKFLTNADYIKWEKVENIERFVDSEIENAIAELTKQMRRDYVESARDALKHFAAKVAEELGELPEEINRDLFMGYKGLMKQMEGERSENINRLRNVESRMLRALSSAFQNFFAPLDEYLRKEIERLKKQSDDEKNPSLPKSEEPYAAEWDAVHSDVNALLNYLCVTQGFDDRLRGLLHNLTDALTQLRPQGFQKPSTPTLDSVSRGLSAFAGEFGGAYISTYSGAECREADADKYAKVLLSMIPMTHEALNNLANKCGGDWRSYKICKLTGDDRDNGLGNYLTKCGFKVSPTDGLQEGELQNHGDMNGEQIHALLNSPVDVSVKMLIDGKPAENGINVVDLVALFYNMLCRYLQVCHLKVHESPRYPCTVRDMLSWLSGLQYTPVADKLPDHCRALLNRKCDDNDAPNRDDAVMAQCINGLPYTIAEACSHADLLLIAIQGHGRGFDLAAYPYSVDFANNTAQLYYPADPDELLEMMRRIICRLCRVLYFLYAQCCRATATTKGWRECHYGRQVPSSHWQCNPLNKQATDASHNCPPTSPLQSFLTDSCPSLLPHKLSVVDNAIECADCPANLPGQQCLTPLGFWDLGVAASMRRTGRELSKSLGRLCSDADACLFQLCRTLRLLCPSAPQSLGDVFALFSHLLRMWNHESSRRAYSHHESYLTHLNGEAIDKLFPLWPQLHGSYQNSNLTNALNELAGHDHDNSGHNALSSLSAEPPCQSPSGCAPFLQPLALHANHTFPQKHAQLYVSWIVWLAWQLWELLESLLDALNNIDCTAHGCATCLCQPSNHNDKDSCHCPSLVECGGPLPTLYRYGFTYRNAHALLAGSQKIRCSDLNDQLTKALHSDHFTQLFHQIDHSSTPSVCLFAITALWLIATLYILHSLLYRMDVLRIRSHLLTTRASHLVDVKALLAGSRRMLSPTRTSTTSATTFTDSRTAVAPALYIRLFVFHVLIDAC